MEITYRQADEIVGLLKDLKVDLNKSLARRRFLRCFKNTVEDLIEIRREVQDRLAIKNPDGQVKSIGTKVQYEPDNLITANKEFEAILNKKVEIDLSKNITDTITCVEILENEIETVKKFANGMFTDDDTQYIERLMDVCDILKNI